MIKVNIINKSDNELPSYATTGSAGMDLRANLGENVAIINPLQREVIPTGIFIELPVGYEAQVRPRSGLAMKRGLTVLNTPGTVDSDYRGEIKIILINLSNETQIIGHGERIAQMIIAKHETAELNQVEVFDVQTERGSGGFGHTGI